MKFYQVVQRYYDSGKVQAHCFTVEADEQPENTSVEKRDYDEYFDYFADRAEADYFRQKALNA
jgi:hypothetical protein